MGTHPIFESDFDCLTDHASSSLPELQPDWSIIQLFAWLLIQLISIICPDHSSTEKMAAKWKQILILGHHLLKDNTIHTNFTITIKCLFMMLWLIAITCVSSHQMPDLLMSNTEKNNFCHRINCLIR